MSMDWDAEYERDRSARHGFYPSSSPNALRGQENQIPTSASNEEDSSDAIQVEEVERELTKFDVLIRHWLNERHCPDILPCPTELLESILHEISQQSDRIQKVQSNPIAAETEHLRIMLLQTEIERVKFVVRSYIRTRLFKIEKYARHITQSAQVQEKISEEERKHASRHANITDQHFYSAVLQSLPPSLASLDDTPFNVPPIVAEPDKTRPVFVHALKQCPPVRLSDGNALEMAKGHISLVPYHVVEHLVLRGDAELI